jgi:NAD(P)H-dependent flavin oxidoreductase YrpB (nitropropane dioxygenase family)
VILSITAKACIGTQVVDAISSFASTDSTIPVVAADGIMDGRGLIASLALGAAGILLGTRFMVARESGTFRAYRERMFNPKETDTVVVSKLLLLSLFLFAVLARLKDQSDNKPVKNKNGKIV